MSNESTNVSELLLAPFLRNRNLVMFDFYADWCEPCKWAEPIVGEVLNSLDTKIDLEKINIDKYPDVAKTFHVLSVPTFILMKDGVEVWRMRGFDIVPVMKRQILEKL